MGVIFSFVSVSHGVLDRHASVSSMTEVGCFGSSWQLFWFVMLCCGQSCHFKFLFWSKMALLKHDITALIVSLDLS